jgi:hypothetical protein
MSRKSSWHVNYNIPAPRELWTPWSSMSKVQASFRQHRQTCSRPLAVHELSQLSPVFVR